jgi:2-polyprenyl-3-methyl-5-hydroxy-6-metoxy-1,4-benzoquinol methylase
MSEGRMSDGQAIEKLNALSQEAWDANAEYWDASMAAGRGFQRKLIEPEAERLLAVQPDERVLEVACGNGMFARRMAALGAHVVATDFSQRLLALARERTTENAERIEYRVVDATDETQLLALGVRRFDAAVCLMGMMDMPTVEPLARALTQVLKPAGRFVIAVTHPCFNGHAVTKFFEEEDRDGQIVLTRGVKIRQYKTFEPARGLAVRGQPQPHWYFMRTLTDLFEPCFRAGFVMDALGEPAFAEPDDKAVDFGWSHFPEIPPVLIARLRLP